jgi:hypothetical protein
VCGRCYQLQFDGTGHYNAQDPGSVALAGKTMIVQATNIGFDVGGGQFDILTPGGGVGLFDACSYQWGVATPELGATYGGFMTFCQQQGGDHEQVKQCVLGRCAAVFDDPGLAALAAGCEWYVDWYEAADNPNLRYQEVACPPAIVAISGIDRGTAGRHRRVHGRRRLVLAGGDGQLRLQLDQQRRELRHGRRLVLLDGLLRVTPARVCGGSPAPCPTRATRGPSIAWPDRSDQSSRRRPRWARSRSSARACRGRSSRSTAC